MLRSLTMKFIMLAGTLGFILALNWSGADRSVETKLIAEQPSLSFTHSVASTSASFDRKAENAAKNFSSSLELRESADLIAKHQNPKAIDLNLSTVDELQALPGIGPVLAKRIVEHRKQVGDFQSLQDLNQVKGIGPKKILALSPMIKISPNIVGKKQQG